MGETHEFLLAYGRDKRRPANSDALAEHEQR